MNPNPACFSMIALASPSLSGGPRFSSRGDPDANPGQTGYVDSPDDGGSFDPMRRARSFCLTALLFLGASGCREACTSTGLDAGLADALVVDAPPQSESDALGVTCSAAADCLSGFCIDGVCCDSPCDETCSSCALAGMPGHCGAQTQGEDPVSLAPCLGPYACFPDPVSGLSSCKLQDGATCQADADCGSGDCLTYYRDADGDGYGSSEAESVCNEIGSAAPIGFSAYSGDCCDLDAGANPAFINTVFLEFPDACGSFDWNCDGTITRQRTCPGAPTIACGAACTLDVGLLTLELFTEACH